MYTPKNIFIVGSGAIGKALAVFLSHAGYHVQLLRASVNDIPASSEKIEMLAESKHNVSASVRVSSLAQCDTLDGLVVITSKSYGNRDVVNLLKTRVGNSPIVIMQNGLSVENIFIEDLEANVYRCVLFATSQFDTGGILHFKPVSSSLIGAVRGNENELKEIVTQLNSPSFPFKSENNIQRIVWKKSITNCVFNSICPLLETDNGFFHRNTEALSLARMIVDQCIKVARLENIELTSEETIESLLTISKFSDGQLISTYQDIRNGRETEIDTLNLAVAAIADRHGKQEYVRETKLLGELIRLKASNFRQKM